MRESLGLQTAVIALSTTTFLGLESANAAPLTENKAASEAALSMSDTPQYTTRVRERVCHSVVGRYVDHEGFSTTYVRLKWRAEGETYKDLVYSPYDSSTNTNHGHFRFRHVPRSVDPGKYKVKVFYTYGKDGHPNVSTEPQGIAIMNLPESEPCN